MTTERKIARAKVANRKNEYGEWVVRAYDSDGKRYPEADYFTTDKADAVATAAKMIEPRRITMDEADELFNASRFANELNEVVPFDEELDVYGYLYELNDATYVLITFSGEFVHPYCGPQQTARKF